MIIEKHKWAVSTFLTVLALTIPLVLYLISLQKKTLLYEVLSKSELIGSSVSIEDLDIQIKSESISNAVIYSLRIKNAGTEPIMKSDFERAILLRFEADSKVFHAKIKNKNPENLSVSQEFQENIVSIEPFLFNPDEEFEVEILSSSDQYPSIDSRIAGITNIDQRFPDSRSQAKLVLMLALCFVLTFYYARFGGLAVFDSGYLSTPLFRFDSAVLSVTCLVSSIILGSTAIEGDIRKNPFFGPY